MTESANRANIPPPDRFTALWRRIKEHRIAQWTVGYAGLAYAIQHAVVLTGDAFGWPQTVQRVSMLLLWLGVPLVMTLAWYHGSKANRRISGPELSILSVLLVGVSILFYVFVRPDYAVSSGPTREAGVTAARAASASPKGAISVAVLPFLNLSSDKEQEFFSDGMTEEITAALAKVPDMRVVARTSAFEFKGKNIGIQSIGQQLHATHLIEGSVRKAGNRVRITAQLIKADDGTHIWAEDYDRELTDVFAIQEDIARAITASLHMTLGLKPGENLINNRNIDPDGYQQYLRARNLLFGRSRQDVAEAAAIVEQLAARNPDYAPAWAQLAGAYYLIINTSPEVASGPVEAARRIVDTYLSKAEAAARRAIQLDPNYPNGYLALGLVLWERGKLLDGEELTAKAFSMDPTDPQILNTRMLYLAIEGRLKEAAAVGRQLQTVEPYVPALNANTATVFWVAGDSDAALVLAQSLPENQGGINRRSRELAITYASRGRYREAADLLDKSQGIAAEAQKEAARMLRMAPKAPDAQKAPYLREFSWVYLHVGAPERALEEYERQTAVGFHNATRMTWIWHPSYAPARKTGRFNNIVRHLGLTELWRAKGWPPQCHPTTGDDFECS